MATLSAKRHEKRWNVFSKAHSVKINSGSIVLQTFGASSSYTYSNVALGATKITCQYAPTVRAGMLVTIAPNNSVSTKSSASCQINEVTSINGNDINLKYPTAFAYTASGGSVSCYVIPGVYHGLSSACVSGQDLLNLGDNSGLNVGNLVCIGYGTTNLELCQVISLVGSDSIMIERGLYYDHTSSETVVLVDDTKSSMGADSRYIYDIVKGTQPSGGDVVVSSSKRTPWILELETTSFIEAKDKVNQLANLVGLDNVRLERVVDVSSLLEPIV